MDSSARFGNPDGTQGNKVVRTSEGCDSDSRNLCVVRASVGARERV